MKRGWACAAALLVAAPGVAQQDSAGRPQPFTALFAETCMQYFYKQDMLRSRMQDQQAPVLEGEQAAFFLGGEPGTAWAVTVEDVRYAVALREDGVCAVYANRAPAAEVHMAFAALVEDAPAPMKTTRLPGDTSGPSSDTTKTASYSWHQGDEDRMLLFTLSTSTQQTAGVQAMATLTLVARD